MLHEIEQHSNLHACSQHTKFKISVAKDGL
jgi:hypothetical protein